MMNSKILLGVAGLTGAIIVLGQMSGADSVTLTPDAGTPAPEMAGGGVPDVIVGDLQSTRFWTQNGVEASYSVGTTSCNIGTDTLDWIQSPSNRHPVIGQTMFRLLDGRFEMIGQSWLKHSFCALQGTVCGSCGGGGGCQQVLHPGCSDPYTASRNGSQSGLGPKWQVNANTGVFPVPWAQGEGTSGEYRRRLRVQISDLAIEGAKYYVEGQYVTQDDATVGNQNNNASYRGVTVNPSSYQLGFSGVTVRELPAIHAWGAADGTVTTQDLQVIDDGLFIVAHNVYDNEDGTWDYEYAIHNLNSHQSGQAFSMPMPSGATITNLGFHDVPYHSGDGTGGVDFDGTDWTMTADGSEIRFETETFAGNESANALRWGTMYNFRFTADTPPTPVTAELGLFRPGTVSSVSVTVDGPSVGASCPEDIDGNGSVDFGDLLAVLAAWGNTSGPEDIDSSGVVDFGDLLLVLAAWGDC